MEARPSQRMISETVEKAAVSPSVSDMEQNFAEALSAFEQQQAAPDEALEGTIIAIRPEGVYVDIGRKTEGVLPIERVQNVEALKPGDRIAVAIRGWTAEGNYELSTVQAERPKDWSALEAAFAEQRTVSGVVTEAVKGGLRVDIGVPAFMPASRSGIREMAELPSLIGQEIRCRITKLDVGREDVVVDRRVVLEEEERRAKEERFAALQEGDVVRGRVRSLTDFGAFVDLGGVDGLLHVTDMSWHRVSKPADLLQVGQEVEVKVLRINRDNRRISLGMKQLQPDPWRLAAEKYKAGDRVRGKVVRLTEFGAFVEVEPGLDGLIHVSEMSWSRKSRKPSDVVKVGETVEAVVLSLNPAEKRLSLGLKQALGDPWDEVDQRFPIGTVVEGAITHMANFGAFVDLGDGFEGMIHVGDITREKRLNHPREVLQQGQVVKAAVVEIDRDRRRIRLSMKQLEPTQVDHFIQAHQVGDVVSGRIVEIRGTDRMRIELGEGVFGSCRLKMEEQGENSSQTSSDSARPDLATLTAQLAAKWKFGGVAEAATQKKPSYKPGQVRKFRIIALDPEEKKIQLEPVES